MMDNYLKELISSSREILEQIESLVLKIESSLDIGGDVEEWINTLFRHFHTIKGNSGFFALSNVVNVAHSVESMLNRIRKKSILLNQKVLDLIIESKDFLAKAFEFVESTKADKEVEEEAKAIQTKFEEFLAWEQKKEISQKEPSFGIFEDEPNENSIKSSSPSFGIFEEDEPKETATDKIKIDLDSSQMTGSETEEKKENLVQSKNTMPKKNIESSELKTSDIRIDIKKIDTLIDSIGELVIAESLVTQNPDIKVLNLKNFDMASENLNKAVKFIQDISLGLRMLPVESIFQRMERLVRDLAKRTQKKVGLEIFGNETEIDKNILEYISDPIMHIIRNSIDHGIEKPEERLAKSKKERATVSLEAYQTGNIVVISISDDGKGLDRTRILKKAEEHGLLVKPENEYRDEEVWNLIFLPGFSTAENVSDISGRGVGMDVVWKNIQKLNGEILIESRKDIGTKISFHIPMTLAIIEGMIAVNRERYFVIPTIDIREVINFREIKITELNEKDRVMFFREKLIPIINFQSLVQNKLVEIEESKDYYVIIVESKKNYLAVIFDDIIGYHNIVIKQMSELFRHLREYSGCTILGNGDIGLILDIRYLVERFLNFKNQYE